MNRPSSERLEMPSLAYALESLFFTVPAEMPMCHALAGIRVVDPAPAVAEAVRYLDHSREVLGVAGLQALLDKSLQ